MADGDDIVDVDEIIKKKAVVREGKKKKIGNAIKRQKAKIK
jgi:hypothetical protein